MGIEYYGVICFGFGLFGDDDSCCDDSEMGILWNMGRVPVKMVHPTLNIIIHNSLEHNNIPLKK